MTNNTRVDEWTGCYDQGWQNLISPAAFSHPAKFSRGLIFRIIEHALEDGLIQPGQTILDPFGGVALGALPALQNGLNWIGVELESKFVELGRQNIALWNSRFSGMPRWTGEAQIIQGDSRNLAQVVSGAGLVVGSPPFHDSLQNSKERSGLTFGNARYGHKDRVTDMIPHEYGSTPGQLATLPPGTPPTAVISSPPYANQELGQASGGDIELHESRRANGKRRYADTSNNLGNLKEGDISAVISSPSFAGNTGGRGEASRNGIDSALFDRHSGGMKKGTGSDPANLDHLPMGNIQAVIGSPPFADSVGSDDPDKRGGLFRDEKRRNDTNLTGTYGETPGQLGAMKAGEVAAVVGSPPFDAQMNKGGSGSTQLYRKWCEENGRNPELPRAKMLNSSNQWGDNPENIGNSTGDTFWSAARLIVEQCALLLPPGGAAIWVVKAYVKNGKIVDFPGQWQALCEACGFETVHEHRAMLVKRRGSQGTLEGESVSLDTSKKSFFRRLAERKGSPPHRL